jgi:flagellar motor protein MotB
VGWGLLPVAGCSTAPQGGIFSREPSALAQLHARLERDLAGTPVELRWTEADGPPATQVLRIVVPQPHGFEPGSAAVRPALTVVLDRIAEPGRSQPNWSLRCTGPVDARKPPTQGADRAGAVRDYLVLKGLAAARFVPAQASGGAFTEIVITARALPVSR